MRYAGRNNDWQHLFNRDIIVMPVCMPVICTGQRTPRIYRFFGKLNLHCQSHPLPLQDKWEYPWYASWDSAFHMIPMAVIDPFFAKEQLLLFLREWYMHPNGPSIIYIYSLLTKRSLSCLLNQLRRGYHDRSASGVRMGA